MSFIVQVCGWKPEVGSSYECLRVLAHEMLLFLARVIGGVIPRAKKLFCESSCGGDCREMLSIRRPSSPHFGAPRRHVQLSTKSVPRFTWEYAPWLDPLRYIDGVKVMAMFLAAFSREK